MKNHTTITVVVQGVDLTFKTDDPKYIKGLAAFLDKEIEKITKSDKVVAPNKAALLAAFNMADELFRLRKEKSETSEEVSRRLDAMLQMAEETYKSARTSGKNG